METLESASALREGRATLREIKEDLAWHRNAAVGFKSHGAGVGNQLIFCGQGEIGEGGGAHSEESSTPSSLGVSSAPPGEGPYPESTASVYNGTPFFGGLLLGEFVFFALTAE